MITQTLVLNSFFDLWNKNPNIFNALPELSFIPPLAAKLKAKGCACGMAGDIQGATSMFNEVVGKLTPDQVARFKAVLGLEALSFGIQTPTSFGVATY